MAPSVAAQTGASLGLPVLVLYHYFFCCRKLVHEGMYCFFFLSGPSPFSPSPFGPAIRDFY